MAIRKTKWHLEHMICAGVPASNHCFRTSPGEFVTAWIFAEKEGPEENGLQLNVLQTEK